MNLRPRLGESEKMKKLRWVSDGPGGLWELDVSTPMTLEGEARSAPGNPLPLGISRGTKLSRAKQLHFFHRFMAAPFVPSFSAAAHGFSLQRAITFPFTHNWFASLLAQFNVNKFVSSLKQGGALHSSRLQKIRSVLGDKSLYALGFNSELLLTPDDILLLAIDVYGDSTATRKKAVFQHKFPQHNLTVEALWPGLFVDKAGGYWDVPFSMAIDLASVAYDSDGASYHLCMHHNSGLPKQVGDGQNHLGVPATLLPGTIIKTAFSFNKNIPIWRSKSQKLKMMQPFDIFLSNPHISASTTIGAAATASIGASSVRSHESQNFEGVCLSAPAINSALLADMFSSLSMTAQHGNFQKLFLDLTRVHARLDFPSGSKFLLGASQLAQDFFDSRQPRIEAVQAICPKATISLQQQIAGPFSFRVDSKVMIDLTNKDQHIKMDDPVFAIEYALQVLGSAKAVAWYSPKQQEFMVELRLFET